MIYLSELPKPMTKEEKTELYENWNDESWKVFVERNIRFVQYIANKFYNTELEYEELFGTGQLGLVKAAKTFNPTRNTDFASYATCVMNNEILMRIRREKKTYAAIFKRRSPYRK